jgi:hypothetical protein
LIGFAGVYELAGFGSEGLGGLATGKGEGTFEMIGVAGESGEAVEGDGNGAAVGTGAVVPGGEGFEVLGVLVALGDCGDGGPAAANGSWLAGVAAGGDVLGDLGDFGVAGTAAGRDGIPPETPGGVVPTAPTVSILVGVDESTSGVRVTIVPSLGLDKDAACGRATAVTARATKIKPRIVELRYQRRNECEI